MFTEEYVVYPFRFYKFIEDNGKTIYCKREHLISYDEIKIEEEDYNNNKPKIKLTLEKKSRKINLNVK